MIKMKVHVFSDSTLSVGVSNPDPSNIWPTKNWRTCGTNTDLPKNRIVGNPGTGASAVDIKQHIQTHLNGRNPESFEDGIIFMSMFSDTEWTKTGNTETCLHNAKEVTAFATQFQPRHWCFLELASEKTWWIGNSNKPQGK